MLSRILVLDDLFGQNLQGGRNADRENLCAHFLWQDVTGDAAAMASRQKILQPTAEVVFCRGQSPSCSAVGDIVENDLEVSLNVIRKGWTPSQEIGFVPPDFRPWTILLLDLCFYTGKVTHESDRRTPGMPEGRQGDDDPCSYFGLTLLDAIHREFPELPVLILSSKSRDEVSLEFSRRGALGFISRDNERGPELLEEAILQHGLLPDLSGEVIGRSLPLLLALREARRAGRHRENLLIQGERGAGKELLARYVHRMNNKSQEAGGRPFVAVNSAVFTPNLFASELFGIEPRTATGVDGKAGLIEMASRGDLFLDEIADMSPEVQASLLRVLQDRHITRVGSRQPKEVDVRFLSATNSDLENGARDFRSDLLDRLRFGGTVWLPPLRERPSDIPLLVEKLVREAEDQRKGSLRRDITLDAFEALRAHDWPGNIRELKSIIFDAVNRFPDVEHLVPGHFRFGADREPKAERLPRIGKGRLSRERERQPEVQRSSLDELLNQLAATTLDSNNVGEWAGKLGKLQMEHAWLVARMLQAALEATKRRTPERPEGIIQIHPAVKLMTGDATLTASKAADLIKRLLGPLEEKLEGDLREAHLIAIRLRPRSTKESIT
jgi:DNA-binding NtrC family response regulator